MSMSGTNQKMMDGMVNFVTKTFDGTQQILPMWTLENAKGEHFVYLTPFGDSIQKDLTSLFIRREIKRNKAVRIGFMSETWISKMPANTSDAAAEKVIPSEDPNRSEAVYLVVEDREGNSLTTSIEIKRDAKGKGHLQQPEKQIYTQSKGRFANMFDADTDRTTH